ncbi:hypothetical protein GCM10007092_16500 [Thermus composti]|nr:hypothetical protein GCM10007092_16500 [Thermus composti]
MARLTPGRPFRARLTVATETRAASARSRMVRGFSEGIVNVYVNVNAIRKACQDGGLGGGAQRMGTRSTNWLV